MQFQNNGVDLGSPVTLVNGIATVVSGASLQNGSNGVQAFYMGDLYYGESLSAATQIANTPFSLTATAGVGKIGAAITALLTLAIATRYTGSVQLSCTMPASLAEAACFVNPSPVVGGGPAVLTVNTTPSHAIASARPFSKLPSAATVLTLAVTLVPFARCSRVYPQAWLGLVSLCVLFSLLTLSGCSGNEPAQNTNPGTLAGTYVITVTALSSSPGTATPYTQTVDDALSLDTALQLTSENTTVTVTDTPVHIHPDNTQLGEVISGRQMLAVPLDGRSFTDLLSLQAGVIPQTSITSQTVQDVGATAVSPSGSLNPGTISINGQREFANAFVVNGADVEEDVNSGTAIVPNLDSIDEFRILISNFDSQYGGYSGGQIKVITKSGSNAFHGSAFEFFRNTDLDARNYFSPRRGAFHQNQYGGTIGGPIHKDKVFFFADYQGTRQVIGIDTGVIPVPSVADRSGDISDLATSLTGTVSGSYFASLLSQKLGHTVVAGESYYVPGCTTSAQCVLPNGIIPQSAFALPAQNLLQYIPAPNQAGGTNFSTSAQKQTLGDNKGGFRTDYDSRLGRLSAYYFLDNYNLDNPYPVAQSGASVPGFNALNTGRAQLATLSLTTPIGEKTVNEVHVSYLRDVNDLGQPVGGLGVSLQSQGFVNASGAPSIVALAPNHVGVENIIFNNFSLGTAANELRQVNNIAQVTEDVSRILRSHTFRVGFNFHHDEVDGYPIAGFDGDFQFTGTETGSDFADFLLGVPTAYNQSQLNPFYGRNNYYGAYAQDGWRVSPSLFMNFGARLDHIAPWSEEHNEISTFRAGAQSVVFPGAPAGILYPGEPGVPSSLAPAGNELRPRIGISYTPHASDGIGHRLFGDGKAIFRAGFGSYFTAVEATTLGVLAANAPYGITYTSPLPPLFQNPFVTASTGQNLGQQFPVQLAPTGAPRRNPNPDINWTQFTPISGIPAFPAQIACPTSRSTPFPSSVSSPDI